MTVVIMYECPILRWQCNAGHFLAESAVESEDVADPDAYYGVMSRIWATCKRCGHVEDPRLIEIGREQIWGSP